MTCNIRHACKAVLEGAMPEGGYTTCLAELGPPFCAMLSVYCEHQNLGDIFRL